MLAGMVALYSHVHFALIDNDCLPLTLFEVAELWSLASPERVPIGSHSADKEEPTRMESDAGMQQTGHPHKRARTDPDPEPCPPQGVILFTEPHSELNAGLVVIGASRHSPIVDLSPLDMPVATRAENDGLVEKLAADAIVGYQRLAQRYVSSALDPATRSSEEASIWIQTGLALTPFAFAETRHSVDWAIAWAMIGEWTNHQLFPPPKSGEWPRFAHVEGLEEGFHHRLAPTATAPDAILALLRDEGFPLWTLTPPPNRKTAVIETLVCFATIVSTEGASTVAALSLHGLLPESFPRHAWNLAVGTWFRLGGTQKTSMAHKLYCIPAGQQTMPLPQSVSASPKCLVGFTSEGKEVNVELTNTHLCLGTCTDTEVWVAIFLDTCLPYLNLRKSLSVECTGLGGSDLNSPNPWDLLIRTGRHHEEVYGPSLARLEFPGAYNQQNVMYVGLGLTKATHEFVILHYFATDSAQIWDEGTVFQIIRELTQAKEHRRRFGHRRHDNPQDEAEAWKTHFALIQQGVGDIPDTIWSDVIPLQGEFNWLDNPPTPEEVQRAINNMKMGKAPGPDMFMAEYLKFGGPALRAELFSLVQLIWSRAGTAEDGLETQQWPQAWTKGIIFPLWKRKGDRHDRNTWRGITLLSVGSKLVARICAARLQRWTRTWLNPFQFGFRKGSGVDDVQQITTWMILSLVTI